MEAIAQSLFLGVTPDDIAHETTGIRLDNSVDQSMVEICRVSKPAE